MPRLLLALALLVAGAGRAGPVASATGIDERPRRGTFVETTLGFFTAMGGSRPFSNVQPYLGLSLGRELGERGSLFISLGIGAASASCYQLASNGDCLAADSFGASFAEIGGAYGARVTPRLLLSIKLVSGLTALSPGPVRDKGGVPDNLFGLHLGGGAALDYDTHLDHFAVGVDALVRVSLVRYAAAGSPPQTLRLPTLAVMPKIRYVF